MIGRLRRRSQTASAGSRSDGFTLIEIMVATLILLVAMSGIVPFYIGGLARAASARQLSVATNIARQKMEEIRQLDYREVVQDYSQPTDPRNLSVRFGESVYVPEREMTFSISYVVEKLPGQAAKSVQVTVAWDAPPAPVSPAVVKTIIAEQYMGPKMGNMVVSPTGKDDVAPGGTPFPLLKHYGLPTTIRCYIAESDWFLAYDNLSLPLASPNKVWLKYQFRDDTGGSVLVHEVSNAGLKTTDDGTRVTGVFFEDKFEAANIPDGYWDLVATMYNSYDEPGNSWQLRVRVEKGPPVAPSAFSAQATSDHSVVLSWIPGGERDRKEYVLERREVDADGSPLAGPAGAWTTIADALDPNTTTFTDMGEIDPGGDTALDIPPCGRSDSPRHFQYRLYGIDTGERSAPDDPTHAATSAVVTLGGVVATTKVTVPDVTGMLLDAAKAALDATKVAPLDPASPGLGWSVTQVVDDTVPTDTVLQQTPVAGTQVEQGSVVALTVATATAPPATTYQVTFEKTDNPGITIYVFDSSFTKVFTADIKKQTGATTSLVNGHYSISTSPSGTDPFQSFNVTGADLTVTIP